MRMNLNVVFVTSARAGQPSEAAAQKAWN